MSKGRKCDYCGEPGATVRVGWNHPFTQYLHFHPACKALHFMLVEECLNRLAIKNGWSSTERHSEMAQAAIQEAKDARAVEEDQKRQLNLFEA